MAASTQAERRAVFALGGGGARPRARPVVGRNAAGAVGEGRRAGVLERQPEDRVTRQLRPVGDCRAHHLGEAVDPRGRCGLHLHVAGQRLLLLRLQDERLWRERAVGGGRREAGVEQPLGVAVVQLVPDRGLEAEGVAGLDEAVGRGVDPAGDDLLHRRIQRQDLALRGHVGVEAVDLLQHVGVGILVGVHVQRVRRDPGAERRAVGVHTVDELPAADPLGIVAVVILVEAVLVQHLLAVEQAVAVRVGPRRAGPQPRLVVVPQAVAVAVGAIGVAAGLALVQVAQAVEIGVPEAVVGVGAEGQAVAVRVAQPGEEIVPRQRAPVVVARQVVEFAQRGGEDVEREAAAHVIVAAVALGPDGADAEDAVLRRDGVRLR